MNAYRKLLGVAGEVLRDLGSEVKANDKSLVVLRPNCLFQKLDSRFLLEFKSTSHRFAGVDQQADLQRQIRLTAEAEDLFGRLLIVENLEIVFRQVLDVVALLISDGEDQVDFVRRRAQGENRFIRCWWRVRARARCSRILRLRGLSRSHHGRSTLGGLVCPDRGQEQSKTD